MVKEFILYEQALALKELEFDEPCFGLYHNDKTLYPTQCKSHEQFHGQICSAPLRQQAFRWFREKKNIYGTVIPSYTDNKSTKDKFIFEIAFDRKLKQYSKNWYYNTYEEAEQACLNKLIEIVKNK